MNLERWLTLMRALGCAHHADTWRELSRAYAEPHRFYHTARHIQSCLNLLDEFAPLAEHPHEVELALWFHDAVYQPLSGSNELRSAELAAQFLRSSGASPEQVDRVYDLIMATRHAEQALSRDKALLLDIDLAILGASPDEYAEYEAGIRKEYQMVPWFVYGRKRAAILRAFTEREHIYSNEAFRAGYEQAARVNLQAAIARLNDQ